MTNAKNTRRALLTSVMALVICVTMLMGTTFAWFTDTATVAVNKIVSGNLDIALYAGEVVNGALVWDTKETDENTELFDKTALWEPGYTEVAYLKITNKGNLALKYALAVHFANEQYSLNKDGEAIYLSKYLKYGVVELDATNPAPLTTRDAALAVANNAISLSDGASRMDWKSVLNEKDDTKYYALVVYMPDTVGNEANYDPVKSNGIAPSIELGIDLVATQNNVEMDSFNEDYDIGAKYPDIEGIPSKPAQEIATAGTAAELKAIFDEAMKNGGTGDITVTLTQNIDVNGEWTTFAIPNTSTNILIDGAGYTISNLNMPLITGLWGGYGTLTFKDLTIDSANIADFDAKNVSGSLSSAGAFMAYSDAGTLITFEDCHLTNSVIDGNAEYTGGLIGYASTPVEIKNCSVTGSTISGHKSTGALVGHMGADNLTINTCTVTGNTIRGQRDNETDIGEVFGRTSGSDTVTMTAITHSDNTLIKAYGTNNQATATAKLYGSLNGYTATLDGQSA